MANRWKHQSSRKCVFADWMVANGNMPLMDYASIMSNGGHVDCRLFVTIPAIGASIGMAM